MGLPGRRRAPLLRLALSIAVLAAACQTTPPDPDGQPGGARPLSLGALHADQLGCRAGDCADWYRLEVRQPGDLVVLVEAPVGSLTADRDLSLTLADGRGRRLEKRAASRIEGEALITWQTRPGHYMVAVESLDRARTPLPYELSLRLVLPPPPPREPPPPPPPEFDTVVGEVLEVEGGFGDPESVLVDRGQNDGVFAGQAGRLLNDGETIATILVVDAYPEGSRARIEGALSGLISAATRVEIDVPIQRDR